MTIHVWHHGQFTKDKGGKYINGQMDIIDYYDTDRICWIDLRFMLTRFGLFRDYNVYQKLPGKNWLTPIKNDRDVMAIFDYMDVDVPGVLYIEHLEPGSQEVELVPDYCTELYAPFKVLEPGEEIGSSGVKQATSKVEEEKKAAGTEAGGDSMAMIVYAAGVESGPKEAGAGTETHPGAGTGADTDSQTGADAHAGGASGPDAEVGGASGPDAEVGAGSGAATEAGVEAGADTETSYATAGADTETSVDAGTDTQAGGDAGAWADTTTEELDDEVIAQAMKDWEEEDEMSDEEYFHGYKVVRKQASKSKVFGFSNEDNSAEAEVAQEKTDIDGAATGGVGVEETGPATEGGATEGGAVEEPGHATTGTDTCGVAVEESVHATAGAATEGGSVEEAEPATEGAATTGLATDGAPTDGVAYDEQGAGNVEDTGPSTKQRRGKGKEIPDVFAGDECNPPEEYAETEYAPSDSLHSLDLSDGECYTSGYKYPRFSESHMQAPEPIVGLEFESPPKFREFIRHYAVLTGIDIKWQKNEGKRLVVVCRAEGCPFRVYAGWNQDHSRYQIKTLNAEHNCYRSEKVRACNANWLSKKYEEHIRDEPNIQIKSIKAMVMRDLGIEISFSMAFRTKQLALGDMHGLQAAQFAKLRDYAAILLEKNPGSHVKVKTTPVSSSTSEGFFFGIFVSFAPMIQGMLTSCRKIIGVDGCFLKTSYSGVMLSACSRDANNQMYPVAWAVVNGETKETWTWFLETLVHAIGVDNLRGWTFISDRQKGLVESFKLVVPCAHIRFCVRHIYANFCREFKGLDLKNALWKAARALTKAEFQIAMDKIKGLNPDAHEYMANIPPEQWSRSHFEESTKCDLLCNNICESFNNTILETRDKPIITMLETVRRLMMKRFTFMRVRMTTWRTLVCPKIKEIIQMKKAWGAKKLSAIWAGGPHFEVVGKTQTNVVNLEAGTCDCREWQLTGIPCSHVCVCVSYLRKDIETYTYRGYYVSTYAKAYEGIIFPIPDSSQWPEQNLEKVIPFNAHKKLGRQKKARRRGPEEPKATGKVSRKGTVMTCKICKEAGHNSRGCKKGNQIGTAPPSASATSSKKRGRPRKCPRVETAATETTTPTVVETGGSSRRGGKTRRRGRGRGRGTEQQSEAQTVAGQGAVPGVPVLATDRGEGGSLGSMIPPGMEPLAATQTTVASEVVDTQRSTTEATQVHREATATARREVVAKKRKFKEVASRYKKQ